MARSYFITGAQGCIGSWIVKALAERGDTPVIFDQSQDSHRLNAIMDEPTLSRVRFRAGDVTDGADVKAAFEDSGAEHVIHLAGLQVPVCKADPIAGAQVNVIGTLNVFEAARATGVKSVVYASSAAVYGLSEDDEPIDETYVPEPATHYGVFKRCNEGSARIYFHDHGISSVGLRPLTVYGVNRDSGLTSDPTKAMKAAVLNIPSHIRFSGLTDFQYVEDTATAFIACADSSLEGAHVFNLHGETVDVAEIVSAINENIPASKGDLISYGGNPIPIAPSMDDSAIRRSITGLKSTPLKQGVRETMQRFADLRASGRLDTRDIEAELTQRGGGRP
jgi:nucleoside-diphosphate-sugar epimerase